jgi:hypothetical protein
METTSTQNIREVGGGELHTAPVSAYPRAGSAFTTANWRTGIIVFALTLFLSALVTEATLVALDPYDTGRFAFIPLWRERGIADNVSRGRDTAFNSAIIGSSRMDMIQPELLDRATGLRFVSLTMDGSKPIDQLLILRYFLHQHATARAIVIGLDDPWCFNPQPNEFSKQFSAWLYDSSNFTYLPHLFSFRAIEDAMKERQNSDYRADGFKDYSAAFHAAGADSMAAVRAKFLPSRPTVPSTSETFFPAAIALGNIFLTLPPSLAVVLAWTPSHISNIPLTGSFAERAIRACQGAFAAIAHARPRTMVLTDWSSDRPENRVDENYYDRSHYRKRLGIAFGGEIAAQVDAALSDHSSGDAGLLQAVINDMELRATGVEISLTGGRAIASDRNFGNPPLAFDKDPSTFWISSERGIHVKDHAWIGFAFATPQAVRQILIEQSSQSRYRQDLIRVEKSIDGGMNWLAVGAPFALHGVTDQILLPETVPAKLWRVMAAGDNAVAPEDAWTVVELAFFAVDTKASARRQSP